MQGRPWPRLRRLIYYKQLRGDKVLPCAPDDNRGRSFGAKLRCPPGARLLPIPRFAMTHSSPLVRLRFLVAFILLALLGVAIEHAVVQLPVFTLHPVLPLAVLADMLLVFPAVFYLLVVRPYRLPISVLGTAVGAGLALAYWLIPAAQLPAASLLQLIPAGLELLTLGAIAVRARSIFRLYREAATTSSQRLPRLQHALEQELGPAGRLLVAELDIVRYALLGWWARPVVPAAGATAFSSHRESGFVALVAVGCLALLAEAAAVHLLVHLWSPTAAGWLLVAEGYGLLLLVAHGHAVRLQPTLLTADALLIRVGFFWQVEVPRAQLLAAETLRGDFPPGPDTLNLARPLLAAPNVLLTFAAPVMVSGMYGTCRPARRLALYLDQPAPLLAALAGSTRS